MAEPLFRRVRRGARRVPAGLLNAHSEALEQLYGAAVPGGGFDFGILAAPAPGRESFLAVITATDGGDPPKYSWARHEDPRTDGSAATDAVDEASGGPDYLPAYEINGNPSVPVGAVVELHWSWGGECLWFAFNGAGAGAASSLTVRLDDDSVTVAPATQITVPAGSFALSVLGTSDAYVVPRFGTNIQSVGAANLPGTSGRFAREDHVHAGLPPVVIIDITDITDVTVEGDAYLFVYNEADGKPYIVGPDGFVFDLCACELIDDAYCCAPGDCGDYCEESPGEWEIPVAGFGPAYAAFNRDWFLTPGEDACAWAETALVGGVTLTGTLTLDGGGYTLTLTDGATTVVYDAGPPADLDCCAPVTLTPADGGCDPGDPLAEDCAICADGPPPAVNLTVAGCTGDLAGLDGAWAFVPAVSPCWWVASRGSAVGHLELRLAGWHLTLYPGTGGYVRWSGAPVTDCCADATLGDPEVLGGATGTAPAELTLDPQCACPGTITATPVCCPTVCDCAHCPGGALYTYLLTASGFTGDCAALNGDWELRWTTGCTWVGTLGDATCTLTLTSATAGTLTFAQAGVDDVVYTTAAWGCCAGGEFAQDNVAACAAAPATLTVEPCGDRCGPCGPVETTCCDASLPETLYLTITTSTLCCAALAEDLSVELTWDELNEWWSGTVLDCDGKDVEFRLFCDTPQEGCGDFAMNVRVDGLDGGTAEPEPGCSCSPLSLVFDLQTIAVGSTLCNAVGSALVVEVTT